jgi:hypothetical protein
MSAPSWHSVRVTYYDGQDGLLLDGVRPLFASVRHRVAAAYFQRHWLRGPHLRLHFRAAPEVFAARVRPAIDEWIGGYLASRPSAAEVDEPRLLALHAKLARAEAERGPLTPLYPDNSIDEIAYDPRLHTLGGHAASSLLSELYVATDDLAFEMIAAIRAGGARLAPCFDLLVATAHAFSAHGLRDGFVSFHSHAEAFLATTGRADRLRAAWDRQAPALGPGLRARVPEVVAALAGGGESKSVPFVREWIDRLAPLAKRAEDLIVRGELSLDRPSSREKVASISPFHGTLAGSEVYWTKVHDAPWFSRYRFMLNYLYLQLTRLGITPAERFLLCYLVARTAEEVFGVTAEDLVEQSSK